MFLSLVLIQMSNVFSSYWLVWWQERQFPRPQGFYYMGIYAMLGITQACANFLNGTTIAFFIHSASRRLHHDAISRVMYSPMSFFETTPLGRIMERFFKDSDTIDNVVAGSSLDRALSSVLTPAS
ncbi:ABC transporter type 1, transmembrane domain-containing protein [Russula emetica]|nr:ABC transporter type 1, transmembrane domain-containing protein [Russula emetica]